MRGGCLIKYKAGWRGISESQNGYYKKREKRMKSWRLSRNSLKVIERLRCKIIDKTYAKTIFRSYTRADSSFQLFVA
jgi:hypothetical protein